MINADKMCFAVEPSIGEAQIIVPSASLEQI